MPNQLINESSPYLLQHAHNPVNWVPWGENAFSKARAEHKPVLVSIGYSTCHWCHVMERESFEDPDVAAFMNEHFVNIKLDREEHPEIDQIYMEVCQIIQGSGGWPLNVFLLPDKRPFYAGTYYPPRPAHNRSSWMQLLHHLYHTWKGKPEIIEEQASKIIQILQDSENRLTNHPTRSEPKRENPLQAVFEGLERSFDRLEGGFGGAPKFPGTMSLDFLLQYHYFFREQKALDHVLLSLDKMIRGGIYDQIGGGFARYATDRAWLVPHFEKMLYDNALLVSLLSQAYKSTGLPLFLETIEETLEWVEREMTADFGGFFSALDADSEGEEGKFYVWDYDEVIGVLGEDDPIFLAYYDVTSQGNWEGKTILRRPVDWDEFTRGWGEKETSNWKQKLKNQKALLLEYRSKRIRPGLDDKILMDWNALMISAFLDAYKATGKEKFKEMAQKAIQFVMQHMRSDSGTYYHVYGGGKAKIPAFLDDYAFWIQALLDFYEITLDEKWLRESTALTELLIQEFLDDSDGLFFFTGSRSEILPVRKKNLYDSATPSGNSVMFWNLQRLAIFKEESPYRSWAQRMEEAMGKAIGSYPSALGNWAAGLIGNYLGIREIAILGPKAKSSQQVLWGKYHPQAVILASSGPNDEVPLLKGKWVEDKDYFYLCQQYACQAPVETLDALEKSLTQG